MAASVVHSERPLIDESRHILTVYEDEKEFYATWICVECFARETTEPTLVQSTAHAEGMAALEEHVSEQHRD